MAKKRTNTDATNKENPRSKTWMIVYLVLGIGLLTIALFLPVINFDFVNYDDGDYVKANRDVQQGFTPDAIRWAFTTGHAANWHPVTWLSHMLDFQMFGNDPGFHHMTSVFFHALNAVLLFFLVRKWTGALWRSAFIAAIFAFHPVHVESVAWVSERKDVLSGFFCLLTMLFYTRYAMKRIAGEKGALDYIIAILLFAIGLMSKPMLVTLPFVLLLIDLWPLQRVAGGPQGPRDNLWLVLEKLPFLVMAAASSVITFFVQRVGGAVASMESLSLPLRINNAFVSYWRYVEKIFWPNDLAILYPHPHSWPWWQVALSIAFIVGSMIIATWQWRRRPYLFVGFLWFVGTMVPVIGLVQVGIQSMADRYTYIPSIGLSIAVVWLISEFVVRWKWLTGIFAVIAVSCVMACIAVTSRQIEFWHDSESLFKRTLSVTEKNYLVWNNLGFSLPKSRVADAMECYRKSIEINPNYPDALNNLAHALAEQGKPHEAIPLYERALAIQPKSADINNNYGNALAEIGDVDRAIKHYLIALEANKDHADAHNNLGIAYAMRGKFDDAISHLQKAIELDPGKASAHSNLGNAYAVQHKLQEATEQYREALRLKPDESQVHNNLGNVLSEQAKYSEAIEHYQIALKIHARNPEAHYNLALALLHAARQEEAVAHLKAALQLRPNYNEARAQLSALTQTR